MGTVIQSSRKEPHGHLHLGSAVLETDRQTCISEVTPRRMGGTDFPGGRARCLGSAPGRPPDPGPAVTVARGTYYDTSAWCFPVQGTLSHSWWALKATETQAAVRVIHELAVHAHGGPRGWSPQLVLLPPQTSRGCRSDVPAKYRGVVCGLAQKDPRPGTWGRPSKVWVWGFLFF